MSRAEDLHRAVSALPPTERAGFLDAQCVDPVVRHEVERLLAADPAPCPADATVSGSNLPDDSAPGLSDVFREVLGTGSAPAEPAFEHGQFVPGTVLLSRYRIVSLVGRGGMGEVYRADDLKLGQSVALKFLPGSLARNTALRARLLSEVSLARRVSHPNVCRVYDAGEVDGLHFLTMEYVDGDNLSDLLARIGRLPEAKALDIARQICSGLQAAHRAGVLHRDLKPGNIMIDGRGKVVITDFGLAAVAGAIPASDARSGTPAYMAPEQLEGEEVTVRSDVYSLGLVLYEIFTGEPVFRNGSIAQQLEWRRSVTPRTPTDLVEALEPGVDRAVFRCLEARPADRPSSVGEVVTLLPGHDALAAAIAAGETPSPDLVAAAERDAVFPAVEVWSWVAAAVVLAVVGMTLSDRIDPAVRFRPGKPPGALVWDARRILDALGHGERPVADSAFGFAYDGRYIARLAGDPASREAPEGHPALEFWYRESPELLAPRTRLATVVSEEDPPLLVPGMVTLRLGVDGRLRSLRCLPRPGGGDRPADADSWWRRFFDPAISGLRIEDFERGEEIFPGGAAGSMPGHDSVLSFRRVKTPEETPGNANAIARVEMAALGGQAVWFRAMPSWGHLDEAGWASDTDPSGTRTTINPRVWLGIFVFLLPVAAVLARRNMRSGRGDRLGSFRLAVFFFALVVVRWLFEADHVSDPGLELELFSVALTSALATGTVVWVLYLALEPAVRRTWPRALVSWSRLLRGRFRDALVGRDVLVGCAAALGILALAQGASLVASWVDGPGMLRLDTRLESLLDGRRLTSVVLRLQQITITAGLTWLLMLVVLQRVLRSRWLAGLGLVLVLVPALLAGRGSPHDWIAGMGYCVVTVLLLTRYGLVAALAMFFVVGLLLRTVLSTSGSTLEQLSSWHGGNLLVALGITAGLVGLGAFNALAGARPPTGKATA